MNDDTLERIHNFVSQLIEHCHSHLPGVQLIEVKYAKLVSIIILQKMQFEHFLSAFCPFDISEDWQKLLFFILFLPLYLLSLCCVLCLLPEADRLTEQIQSIILVPTSNTRGATSRCVRLGPVSLSQYSRFLSLPSM